MDALSHLGVDEDGDLYWRDTKVMTRKKEFRLSVGQWIVAILTVLAAIAGAAATAVSAYVDWQASVDGGK